MQVKTIAVGPLATNCYIIIEGRQCVVIDPGDDGDRIFEELSGGKSDADSLAVHAILLTHGHFDHTLAAGYLQEKTGAPVFVGEKDKAMLLNPGWMTQFMPSESVPAVDIRTLAEGDRVAFGEAVLEVWETPGHSPGSLAFVLDGARAPLETPKVFCGDLIFRRGVGRTDLPGGDADQLFTSIDRVLRLPGKTAVCPGHGPSTTVAAEKATGPFGSEGTRAERLE